MGRGPGRHGPWQVDPHGSPSAHGLAGSRKILHKPSQRMASPGVSLTPHGSHGAMASWVHLRGLGATVPPGDVQQGLETSPVVGRGREALLWAPSGQRGCKTPHVHWTDPTRRLVQPLSAQGRGQEALLCTDSLLLPGPGDGDGASSSPRGSHLAMMNPRGLQKWACMVAT